MTKRAFGELELSILRLFKPEARLTVKDIHKALGEKDKYTTIMTVMNRLAEKKVLMREREGLQYHYWLANSQTKIPSLFEQIKQRVFNFKTSALVSYLIESSDDISDSELAEMEELIKKAKDKRIKK